MNIPPVVPAQYEMARLTNNELREKLSEAINLTATSIAYLASVWTELERRGEDLSDMRMSLAPFLRDVATGKLAPEAVLSFAGRKPVLRWVSTLPVKKQLEISAGQPVEVRDSDGTIRSVRAADMNARDIRNLVIPDTASHLPAIDQTPSRTQRKRGPKPGSFMSVKVTLDEIGLVNAAARKAGLSRSDYIRKMLKLGPRTT